MKKILSEPDFEVFRTLVPPLGLKANILEKITNRQQPRLRFKLAVVGIALAIFIPTALIQTTHHPINEVNALALLSDYIEPDAFTELILSH